MPVIVGSLAAAAYCVVTDTGPYAIVSRLQADLFGGKHYVIVSGLVTIICALVPALALVHGLASFFPMTAEERAARNSSGR